MRDSCDLVDFDARMVATYHGYRSLDHYYDDMSAASADAKKLPGKGDGERRLERIRRPTFILHAADDPICHADCIPTDAAGPNVCVLMTRRGGHIGWPTGWLPRSFAFSTRLAMDFVEGVHGELL